MPTPDQSIPRNQRWPRTVALIIAVAALGVAAAALLRSQPDTGPSARANPDPAGPDSLLIVRTARPNILAQILWFEGRPTTADADRVVLDQFGSPLWFGDGPLPRRGRPAGDRGEATGPLQGIQVGPDSALYILEPFPTGDSARLARVDPITQTIRAMAVLPSATPSVAVNPAGRVFVLTTMQVLSGTRVEDRPSLRSFDLPTLDSTRLRLADLVGKVVLINLWASWCAPCREEMPALDLMQHEFPAERFAFVTITEDVSEADARRFIDEYGFQFPVGLGRGRMRRQFHYFGLPHTVLVDAEGRAIYEWAGFGGPPHLEEVRGLIRAELARTD